MLDRPVAQGGGEKGGRQEGRQDGKKSDPSHEANLGAACRPLKGKNLLTVSTESV
jgi:hypothetical protein